MLKAYRCDANAYLSMHSRTIAEHMPFLGCSSCMSMFRVWMGIVNCIYVACVCVCVCV